MVGFKRCFSFFLFFNQSFLFSGLLPDNIIYTEQNRCCSVKNLELGDLVVSSCSNQLKNTLNNVSGIKLNKNAANSAILLILESKEKTLSSLMVGADQRFCVQIESDNDDANSLPSLMWLEAECLEQNMLLLGYNNEKLKIRNVQNVVLENSIDLYEISLNPNNTFYLVDSGGNLLLTHNFRWLVGFIIAVVCGAFIGGGIGAGIMIRKSYAKKVKVSKSTILKGFLVGAAVGGTVAAVTYGGIYIGVKYLPLLLDKISMNIAAPMKTPEILKSLDVLLPKSAVSNSLMTNPMLSNSALMNLSSNLSPDVAINLLINKVPALAKLSNVVFVGTVVTKAVPPAASKAYNLIDKTIEDFIVETEKREGANINFSGIDVKQGADKDALNQSYQEMSGKSKILHTEKLIDINGNPISIVFATYNN